MTLTVAFTIHYKNMTFVNGFRNDGSIMIISIILVTQLMWQGE